MRTQVVACGLLLAGLASCGDGTGTECLFAECSTGATTTETTTNAPTGGSGGTTSTTGEGAQGGAGATGGQPTTGGGGQGATTTMGGAAGSGGQGGTGGAPLLCGPLDVDDDGDGFTENAGDCDDCQPFVNPGALELAGGGDNDCNGVVDDVQVPCDDAFAIDDMDPYHAAATIGLCQKSTSGSWGVVDAKYTRVDGKVPINNMQVGLMAKFGNHKPKAGKTLFVISSGKARDINSGACQSTICLLNSPVINPPGGLPQPLCGDPPEEMHDDAVLQLDIKVPTNAFGFSFKHRLFTFDYPLFVCNSYGGQFVPMLSPAPAAAPTGNIALDPAGNPMSASSAFITICKQTTKPNWAKACNAEMGNCPPVPDPYCPGDVNDLSITGFSEYDGDGFGAGATPWLMTTAPVTGGQQISLRFMIWDIDVLGRTSTAIIDDFQWITDAPPPVATMPL